MSKWFLKINAKYEGRIGSQIYIYREYDDSAQAQRDRAAFAKVLEEIGGVVKRVNVSLIIVTLPATPDIRFWRSVPKLTYKMEVNPVQ